MAEAVFGLIGVLVGAGLTVASHWWQAMQTRRSRKRAAARLVLEELANAYTAIQAALGLDDTPRTAAMLRKVEGRGLVGISAWHDHRALLAEELDDKEWKNVSDAYFELALLGELDDDETLVKNALELEGIYKARDALWPHAFPELEPTHDMDALRKQPEKSRKS